MNETIKLQVAAKALIENADGQILILREAATYKDGTHAGRYHLPGGRLEEGEAFYDGLAREVKEETGLTVEPIRPLHVGEWRPVIREVQHQIIALFMLCRTKETAFALSDEHDGALWIDPREYTKYNLLDPEDQVVESYVRDLK